LGATGVYQTLPTYIGSKNIEFLLIKN